VALNNINYWMKTVPTENEVIENDGYDLGAFCLILLEKIEELTIYTIEQEKRINKLETQQNN